MSHPNMFFAADLESSREQQSRSFFTISVSHLFASTIFSHPSTSDTSMYCLGSEQIRGSHAWGLLHARTKTLFKCCKATPGCNSLQLIGLTHLLSQFLLYEHLHRQMHCGHRLLFLNFFVRSVKLSGFQAAIMLTRIWAYA